MAQSEILEYLSNNKGKQIDIIELMQVVPANRSCISRALQKMRKRNEIKYQAVKKGPAVKFIYYL